MIVNESKIQLARKVYGDGCLMKLQQAEWIIRQSGDKINGKTLLFAAGESPLMWSRVTDATFVLHGKKAYRRIFELPDNQALRMYNVNYSTKVESWQNDLQKQVLNTLPPEIEQARYDLVLVNGPCGHSANSPGRVSALLHARMLVKDGGIIFVYDYDRELEKTVATELFGTPDEIDEGVSTIAMWRR